MNLVRFQYEPKAQLWVTRQDMEMLCALAKNHYDSVCRAAESPGDGAFLNGARNRLSSIPELPDQTADGVTVEWTFAQCDIAAKILESANFLRQPFGDWRASSECARGISAALKDAMDGINTEAARLNK
ncbi:MAG: hypothetical protein WCA44_05945 [Acidobacteriaceae bacterium]